MINLNTNTNELTFEIKNICPRLKRKLFITKHELTITAVCKEAKMYLKITIPEFKENDTDYIRSELIKEYQNQMKLRETYKNVRSNNGNSKGSII